MLTSLSSPPVQSSCAVPAADSASAAQTVVLHGLTKRYAVRRSFAELVRQRGRARPVTVVDRVDFRLTAGEVFGLLGPNGAGKTTLLKMLSTMIVPDGGTATVCGYDLLLDAAAVRSVVAAVPADDRSLNWRLSARGNLALFASLYRLPRAETSARIDELLGQVGLENTGSKLVGTFSSGMRQRLLIARALLGQPSILLLDEPTRSLDPVSAQEFRDLLRRELVDRRRCTILLATHNTDEAFTFCDRVAVLHQGRVLATGAADELAARYGEERYRLLCDDAEHPAFAALERRGLLRRPRLVGAADGWDVVEYAVGGGAASTACVVRELVTEGVTLARLERADVSLADLIARIVAAEPIASGMVVHA